MNTSGIVEYLQYFLNSFLKYCIQRCQDFHGHWRNKKRNMVGAYGKNSNSNYAYSSSKDQSKNSLKYALDYVCNKSLFVDCLQATFRLRLDWSFIRFQTVKIIYI